MTYIPEATSTYTITEEEISYVIDALDKAYLYAETTDEGTEFNENVWESMGIMHNLKGEDSKTFFQNKFPKMAASSEKLRMARAIDQVVDAKVWADTDYFD